MAAKQLKRSIDALTMAMLLSSFAHPARAATFTTLYHFTNQSDGGNPVGGVVEDSAGALYGETYQGGGVACIGTYPREGCGTVYRLSRAGGFTVLASFTGANGAHGNITPVVVGTTLFGATEFGGTDDDGVVFSVNTDGTNFTLLHQFAGTDGKYPLALVAGANGTLYGIVKAGGAHNDGILFSLTASGTYQLLHSFALPISAAPLTLVIAPDGLLVGSTEFGGTTSAVCPYGCGTVFQYTSSLSQFATLSFFPSSSAQGTIPYVGSLGPGPTIYGSDYALMFSLAPGVGLAPLADFNAYTTGSGTNSGPVYAKSGLLYGVLAGGVSATDGAIYSYANGVITDAFVFDGNLDGRDGAYPTAKPIVTPSGSVIGTTSRNGDCLNCGTVWKYTP